MLVGSSACEANIGHGDAPIRYRFYRLPAGHFLPYNRERMADIYPYCGAAGIAWITPEGFIYLIGQHLYLIGEDGVSCS